MTIRMVDEGWRRELAEAVRADANELRITCPFIKVGALESLLSGQPGNVQVITRFNLADFAEGVSDIAVLRKLLDINARFAACATFTPSSTFSVQVEQSPSAD